MGKLIFITGGARSGKSTYAEELIRSWDGKTSYIATAIPFDEGMKERIRHHQMTRPSEWETIETYKNFSDLGDREAFKSADNILFDCLTVMTSNQLMDKDLDWENIDTERINQAEGEIREDVETLVELLKDKNSIVVSNEVGMGIVPANYFSSYFRDIHGRLNQYLAREADEVYLCVSGIPVKVK